MTLLEILLVMALMMSVATGSFFSGQDWQQQLIAAAQQVPVSHTIATNTRLLAIQRWCQQSQASCS